MISEFLEEVSSRYEFFKNACFTGYLWSGYILKNAYLEETLSKFVKVFLKAMLVEVFLRAKFRVKIRKYDCAGNWNPAGKI
jgi:hypothetical protein